MTDPTMLMTMASAAIVGLGIVSTALLRGWRDWLLIKRLEVESRGAPAAGGRAPRVELADLKDRVRKLEAIASGVDL